MNTSVQNSTLQSVLYVDDEPDIREVVELALGLLPNVEVRTCGSGAAALELMATWRPSLVLLDVMMPGLDGPETLARMRAGNLRDVPVVFMTAKALPDEVDRFMSLGAMGVISKPFDPMQLGQRLTEMWRAARES